MIPTPGDLPDDQIEVWQQAVEYFHQAYRLQREGDWAGSIHAYKLSIRLYPTAEAYTFLGSVYSSLYLYDEAIAACRRAINVDPEFGNPYNDIGAYLIEQNKFAEAKPWLKQAVLAPRYATRHHSHFHLGRICEQEGDWLMAADHYQLALDITPSYQDARKAFDTLRARLN